MNALLRKEVRLLGPTWMAALLLAVVPLCVISNPADFGGWGLFILLFWIGTLLLGVSSFGRELSAATFSQLLAQPISRQRVWRSKTIVLAVAIATVFLAYYLTLSVRLVDPGAAKQLANVNAHLAMAGIMALTAFAGGLWSTLLLRQYLAAFLITMLTPWLIALPTNLLTEKFAAPGAQIMLLVGGLVLAVYAGLGFWLARWLFLNAQDVAWTGGVITLPRLLSRRNENLTPPPRPSRTQLTALLRKEFHFHQISLIFAGLLLVLHVLVLMAQQWLPLAQDSLWKFAFETFWLFWFVIPLLTGCLAVAEERRLGTLESQLCLPASRLKQFLAKVFMVVWVALALGALPVWIMDWVGVAIGLKSNGATATPDGVGATAIAAVLVALVGFYASSLSRNFLQALATSFGVATLLAFGTYWVTQPGTLIGIRLWEGPISVLMVGLTTMLLSFGLLTWRGRAKLLFAVLVGFFCYAFLPYFVPGLRALQAYQYAFSLAAFLVAGGLVLLVLVLAFQNYRQVITDARLWRRNLGVWLAGLMITSVLATATYHRVWEFTMRFEPPAGPARLSGPINAMISKNQSGRLWALLPDGRLWTTWEFGMGDSKSPRAEFVGSNWVAVAITTHDGVGVRSDGSLWGLSWWEIDFGAGDPVPAAAGNWNRKWQQMRPTPIRLGRMGGDSDWMKVVSGSGHYLAMKRDGTLWSWGDNRNRQVGDGLPDTVSTPVQLGTDADWDFIAADAVGSVAVKRDRTVWKWGAPITKRGIGQGDIGDQPQQIATLPAKVSRIVSSHVGAVFICEDGTGWGSGLIGGNYLGAGYPNRNPTMTTLTKLWDNGHWKDTGGENWYYVAGIQSDGSLWLQDARISADGIHEPVRLGRRNDWLAMQVHDSAVYVLGKDGTLCRFGDEFYRWKQLTRPTRRATWSVNLLDAAQP